MRITHAFFLLAVSTCSINALGNESRAVAKDKGCFSCHDVDRRMIGPAWKEVAARYQGQEISMQIAQRIIKGTRGSWGSIPMPANNVTESEAKILAEWILQGCGGT